ncbi:MAG TPA: DUF4157 domain-containing protein [Allosphingosinicella sp.]|nr:DUF4157 domain-containing protein [Allosphingosinicella sp.]
MAASERRAAPPLAATAARVQRDLTRSVGQPLDGALRGRMEARVAGTERALPAGAACGFHGLEAAADQAAADGSKTEGRARNGAERDFSTVRLHVDDHAASAARRLRARAFTKGENVYADSALLPASRVERDDFLAHELAHVVQQRQLGRKRIQPRLLATGYAPDIARFIALAEPGMGEQLQHDPITHEITAVASLAEPVTSDVFSAPPRSSAFLAAMHRVMDDPAQHAEVNFGTRQPKVAVGGFPATGLSTQQVDIDDVEAIAAESPGHALAKLAHEITENYEAHASLPVAGNFGPSHKLAISVESDVAEETVGPGRRVAEVDVRATGYDLTRIQDFENYYLVFNLTPDFATTGPSVSKVRKAPRINVQTVTIDKFDASSSIIPEGGPPTIAATAAAANANPTATVRVEGFADLNDTPVLPILLSQRRADHVKAALIGAGVAGPRIHSVGLGAARPVAASDTEANQALNRRAVIIIDRPAP